MIMMSKTTTAQILLISVIFLNLMTGLLGTKLGVGEPKCKEAERQALLQLKKEVSDDGRRSDFGLSSWAKEEDKKECCEWVGIRCDNNSGHVITLDLSLSTIKSDSIYGWPLLGNITSLLARLPYLNYLDLSGTIFYSEYTRANFDALSKLTKLSHLNLFRSNLSGEIPPQFGNLSSLQFLDLSGNNGLIIKNLENWLSHLSSLQLLSLSSTNMSLAHDWVHVVNNLPRLTHLDLSGSSLHDNHVVSPSSLSLFNSSKLLTHLDLSENSLSPSIFEWLFNYSHSLVHLDLHDCQFETSISEAFDKMVALSYLNLSQNRLEGSIPSSFGSNMTSLEYLDLSHNTLEGEIPKPIWNLCALKVLRAHDNVLNGHLHLAQSSSQCAHFSLEDLDLRRNRIMGSLPNITMYSSLVKLLLRSNRLNGNVSETIGQLSQLKILDISRNFLKGAMSVTHFSKLFNLRRLDLSSNSHLALNNIPSDWIPPFQLKFIYLRSCILGPHFPQWLQTQKSYVQIDISNSKISDFVPNWFWNSSPYLHHMNLSNNQMVGTIVNYPLAGVSDLYEIDLSNNKFEGPVPFFSYKVIEASFLSNNNFSSLTSLCDVKDDSKLSLLDISDNQLAGEIPDCWSHLTRLAILILKNNKLSGKLPTSIGSLSWIQILHVGSNNLIGNLPSSMSNCNKLRILYLGENKLQGSIPSWVGGLQNLVILSLRSNQFNGTIPLSLCEMTSIQILDLSSNDVYGDIPSCIDNLTAMKKWVKFTRQFYEFYAVSPSRDTSMTFPYDKYIHGYDAQVDLMWKGSLSQYKNTLRLVKSIDLSSNKLTGEIPKEITQLIELVSLNLSRNYLSGEIPRAIGQLKSLDALDLSRNRLFGEIPLSLSQVDRLNFLDLSINNLSGKIPTSTQLQSFSSSSYMGNPQLCGLPLFNCEDQEQSITSIGTRDGSSFIDRGFYVSMGLGFLVAFWGLCGSLVFVKSWRYAYFKLLNRMGDRIYVMMALQKEKLLR